MTVARSPTGVSVSRAACTPSVAASTDSPSTMIVNRP